MSILEKLKNLVASIEDAPDGKASEIQEEDIQQQVAEILSSEEEELKEEPEPFPDYLECTQQETELVVTKLSDLQDAKVAAAEAIIALEEGKRVAIANVTTARKELLAHIESLRLEYGVPLEGYQVKLPSSQENKVSFSKKQ